MRRVRKLRHWKQRFDKNAAFVWRRRVRYGGTLVELGERIPEDLARNKTKLRRFWESQTIELAEFEDPNVATGRPDDKSGDGDTQDRVETIKDLPDGVTVERGKGSWYVVNTGSDEVKVNGHGKLEELLEQLRAEAGADDWLDGNDDDDGDGDDMRESQHGETIPELQ